ncbi:class E sortase [Streptomyces sp. NPDC006711]|uniref:class E sortase n=1 Tax=Streptomyces sp. NPDC006711 TaxID=3364762 RepID=UPI0036AFEB7E
MTLGLVVLLLVAHQLWWTNREARAEAGRTVRSLEQTWSAAGRGPADTGLAAGQGDVSGQGDANGQADGTGQGSAGGGHGVSVDRGGPATGVQSSGVGGGGAPRGDHAYAVIRIPRIGITAPVAQGISKAGVLDKGYVGHYPGSAQPGQAGNFALAGHRNTHGEPFRHLDKLGAGDEVVVETRDAVYTYVVDSVLPQTSARDGGTIAAVPHSDVKPSYGYSTPGHYLTLTTCTPEFTSTYRLVVWGKLRSSRPR